MNQLNITLDKNWNLPDIRIDIYANMISKSKTEMNDLPGPPAAFFRKRLRSLREKTNTPPSFHVIPYVNGAAVGWGHLSVFGEDDSKAELFVHILKEYRHQGFGRSTINVLLEHIPETVKELTIPALIKQRPFMKRFFKSTIESSEKRGIIEKERFNINSGNVHVYREHDLFDRKDLVKAILQETNSKLTDLEYLDLIKKQATILGKKQLFSFISHNNEICGYTHLCYNFEENHQLGYIEAINGHNITEQECFDALASQIEYLFTKTKVEYVLTFDFNENDTIQKRLGFVYINTLDNHTVIIKNR